jgi:hypothetical protein
MKRSSILLALALASATGLAVSAAAESPKSDAVKRIQVQSLAQVKQAFRLSADGGRQAIEISCAPASSSWCANEFVAACDKNDGGMSSDPDGGVTCSLPQHE